MGTSLSGLTPSTTYPALLKTSDNTVINSTLKTISDGSGDDTVLQLSTLRVGIKSDSTVTTQTSSVIQSSTTNANLVIAPNGTGALIADIPDGTTTGGNARGVFAVDLQRLGRTNANQVASGQQSVIIGGYNNRASGLFSTAGGGQNAATNQYATCIGGGFNTSSGGFSIVAGGGENTASSNYSTVSGGQSNTASTNTHATVVGGASNTVSGQHAVAGGQSNTVAGDKAASFGISNNVSGYGAFATGNNNTIAGSRSVAMGQSNSAAGANSVVIGLFSSAANTGSVAFGHEAYSESNYGYGLGYGVSTKLYGQTSTASGYFATPGDSQQSLLTARRSAALTTAATTVLSLDGTGVTNLIIPSGNNRAWNVQVNWVAVVTTITGTATGITVGDTITQVQTLGFKRIGGTSSLIGTANTLSTNANPSMSTASMAYSAGGSQEMAITFTAPTFAGAGSITCRVVARIELTEVAY